MSHFLIEKGRFAFKRCWAVTDLPYLRKIRRIRDVANQANRQDEKAGEANCSFVVIVEVNLSKERNGSGDPIRLP